MLLSSVKAAQVDSIEVDLIRWIMVGQGGYRWIKVDLRWIKVDSIRWIQSGVPRGLNQGQSGGHNDQVQGDGLI